MPARYWEQFLPRVHRSPFADPARRCLFFARAEASSFSRREISVEHLLLGVLREEPSLVSSAGREAVVRAVEASEPAGRREPPMEDLRISDEARRVGETALGVASTSIRRVIETQVPRQVANLVEPTPADHVTSRYTDGYRGSTPMYERSEPVI